MPDEAVVRVVVIDGGGSAKSTAAAQSSTAGIAGSSAGGGIAGIGGDRLYRELARSVTEINKGFASALEPAIRELRSIRDLLDRDHIYSDKEYKESVTHTTLLRLIGASISSDKGAFSREVSKGLGTHSADTQMISILNKISRDMSEMNKNLHPDITRRNTFSISAAISRAFERIGEVTQKGNVALGGSIRGALVGLGFAKLPAILEYSSRGLSAITTLLSKGPGAEAVGITAGAMAGAHGVSATGTATFLAENLDTIGPMMLGALVGGLIALFSEETEKEKSVTELLQEISVNTLLLKDIGKDVFNTSLNTGTTAVVSEQILGKIPAPVAEPITAVPVGGSADPLSAMMRGEGQSKEAEVAMLKAAEGESLGPAEEAQIAPSHQAPPKVPIPPVQPSEIDPMMAKMSQTAEVGVPPDEHTGAPIVIDKDEFGAYEVVPEKRYEPHAKEREVNPYEPHKALDAWEDWKPLKTTGAGVSNFQYQQLIAAGIIGEDTPREQVTMAHKEAYFAQLRAQGWGPPPGFARGGAVGSDSIPAMLSPGEVVVPKNMVDGGAVDHLRGKLPGFAKGGKVDPGTVSAVLQTVAGLSGPLGREFAASGPGAGANLAQVGSAVSAIGSVLPVVGPFVMGLGQATQALGGFMEALNGVADRYGEYSPQIAQAQAMAEVTQVMGDMKRAQDIGNDLAKFVVAQSEMQQHFEEIKIKLLMKLVPIVTGILEGINLAMGSGDGIETAITALFAPLSALSQTANELRGIEEDRRIPNPEDTPTNAILNQASDAWTNM